MEPQDVFTGIIRVSKAAAPRKGMNELLDFAWRYFKRDLVMEKNPGGDRQI